MIYNLKNDLCDEDLKKNQPFQAFRCSPRLGFDPDPCSASSQEEKKAACRLLPCQFFASGCSSGNLGGSGLSWHLNWSGLATGHRFLTGGGWGSLDYQILWFELFFVNPLSLGMGMVGLHRLHSQILKCPLASLFIHHHWSLKTCVSDFHIYYFSIHHISSSSSCWDGFAIQIRFGTHETCKTSTSKFQILQIYNSCQKIFQTYLHRLTMTHQACEWNIVKSCSQIVEVMSHLW